MPWSDLEREIGGRLEELPPPQAPDSLAPRVMRAVALQSSRRTRWSHGWLAWPREAQVASLALVALFAIALWREAPAGWAWLSSAFPVALSSPQWLSSAIDLFNRALVLGRLPWQILQPVAFYFALLALAASLTLAASWQVFTRLIAEGVPAR